MKYKLNGQWVDVTIKPLDSLPIGTIVQFAGETIPTGWLVCDGSSLSTTTYPDLYTIIGTKYGGSGSSFNLPNFKGRVLVGQDTNDTDFDTLGETGGEKKHTLTINEMPSHTHNTENICSYPDGVPNTHTGHGYNEINLNKSSYGSDIGATGGGQAHNILQPYAVVKHIIKAKNTVPTMASMVNSHSNSTTDGYSCDYINNQKVVLYENNTGSNGNITLSDNINNYTYIEIYSRWYDGYSIPAVKLNRSNITSGIFNISWNEIAANKIIFSKRYNISGTSITKRDFNYYIIDTGETGTWDACYITKVVGYK